MFRFSRRPSPLFECNTAGTELSLRSVELTHNPLTLLSRLTAIGRGALCCVIAVQFNAAEAGGKPAQTRRIPAEFQSPFPSRPATSPTGSEFLRQTRKMAPADRESAILKQFRSGNMPSHIRTPVPVDITHRNHAATVYVLPDYLALGSDADYVIIPMAPRTAMQIAREFGFTLPTRKLVDDIYAHSTLRLTPEPMTPGPRMTSNAYYQEHDRRIKSQVSNRPYSSRLMAGHKKDIVLTPRLLRQPGRVAIYGWHRRSGRPIQPLSLFHHVEYVDYSHGVRLVSRRATLDGAEADLSHILSDADLSPLLSDEGRVSMESYL